MDSATRWALSRALAERLDEVVEALGLEAYPCGDGYQGPCPVHGGDNKTAMRIYRNLESDYMPGVWKCWTHGCEGRRQSLVGLAEGVLRGDATPFCLKLLGTTLDALAPAVSQVRARNYERFLPAEPPAGSHRREDFLPRLSVPSRYFAARGVSEEVLSLFDVGDCLRPGLPFFGRAVAPVYSEPGLALGFTARSHHAKCAACTLHHPPGPCPSEHHERHAKWRHSPGLPTSRCLYGLWLARDAIRAKSRVVLVEGPVDVWAAHAAGVPETVALFGASLSDGQQVLLEASGAFEVIIATNSDPAGRRAAEDALCKLKRLFKARAVDLPRKDLAEMTPEQVRQCLT